MIEVNSNTILEFTKLLIECGDVYEVQPDYTVKNRLTGEQVSIVQGKQSKPLMIFHENAPVNMDVVWLNPFKENLGISREREWFFGVITTLAGSMTRYIMCKLVKDAVDKKDDNYGQFDLMHNIIDKADEQMLVELDKLTSASFLSVYYNKREKVAEAQTELFSKELREAFPKFRKKTWEVIEIIFREIFGTIDLEEYKYRATLVNIPETEAKLKVSVALIKALAPLAKDILGKDLHAEELDQHMEVLEGYSRLYAWAPVNQETSVKFNNNTQIPWSTAPAMPGLIPMGQPRPQVPMTAAATDGGQIKFSSYAGVGVPVTNDMYPASPLMPGAPRPYDGGGGLFGI